MRTYNDPSTKSWVVTVPLNYFDMCGKSLNVLSGNGSNRMATGSHQTCHGNVYSADEWAATQELHQVEAEVAARFSEADIKARYRQQLLDLDIPERAIGLVLSFDFDDYVETGRIRFSSPDR